MAEPPAAPNVEPIRELLRVLAEQRRFLTSTRNRLQRQLAAACLARCRSLLEGMLLLREQARDDVAGVLRRCLVEHYLLGRYLLQQPESLDLLVSLADVDYREAAAALREQGDDPSSDASLSEWRQEVDAYRQAKVAQAPADTEQQAQAAPIRRKLPRDQIARGLNILTAYTNIYRRESAHGAHANYYGLLDYIDLDEREERDMLRPDTRDLFPWCLWECGILTAQLALEVNAAFALVPDEQARVTAAFSAIGAAHPRKPDAAAPMPAA